MQEFAGCIKDYRKLLRMKENIPLSPIPLPDYSDYRQAICKHYNVVYPLKSIPALDLKDLPLPLNKLKKGWPWDRGSEPATHPGTQKISVVIPSFQQGKFLEEAVRSVLLQNYAPLELIIIDGGSSDETNQVMNHYKEFISLIVSETDSGQSQALNKGFSMASGQLYYWLNSDDYLNINSFNNVIPFFIRDPKLEIVYGDGLTIDEQTGRLTIDKAPLVLERYLRFGGIVMSHSIIWKSEVHCKFWEDLNCAMDAELWLRLFTKRRFKHSHLVIGTARRHPDQKTAKSEKWDQSWKADYEKYIWKWYPRIKAWKLRTFEYNIVQKSFRIFRRMKEGK